VGHRTTSGTGPERDEYLTDAQLLGFGAKALSVLRESAWPRR